VTTATTVTTATALQSKIDLGKPNQSPLKIVNFVTTYPTPILENPFLAKPESKLTWNQGTKPNLKDPNLVFTQFHRYDHTSFKHLFYPDDTPWLRKYIATAEVQTLLETHYETEFFKNIYRDVVAGATRTLLRKDTHTGRIVLYPQEDVEKSTRPILTLCKSFFLFLFSGGKFLVQPEKFIRK
jgi:hypothetical protein